MPANGEQLVESYRRFRPTRFADVLGQDDAVRVLANYLKTNSVPHVMLFVGGSGTGKTTLARILKDKMGCDDMDFTEVNAANARGIDTIREIQEESKRKAWGQSACRVWLIDEMHQISPAGMSASLKLLEDVPEHVYFFLCTSEPGKLLPALRGRCDIVQLVPLSIPTIKTIVQQVLDKRGWEPLDPEVFDALLNRAEGSARRALMDLDKVTVLSDKSAQLRVLQQLDPQDQQADNLLKRLCFRNTTWEQVAPLLANLEGDAESFRRRLLAFAGAAMLKGNDRAADVVANFQYDTYSSGKEGLYLMAWNMLRR